MIRAFIATLLGVIMALAGCSENAQSETTPPETTQTENAQSETAANDAAAAPEQLAPQGSEPARPEVAAIETAAASENTAAQVNDVWVVDMGESRLGFVATQAGDEFAGTFRSFSAIIQFDPNRLNDARIDVSIDMKSAKTGDRQRDAALPNKEWFDAKANPAARFVSREVVAMGEGAYEARGALTIRGVTRNVALPFTLVIDGDAAQADGGLTLVRTDYGVGQGEWESDQWVGFDVKVVISISAHRAS